MNLAGPFFLQSETFPNQSALIRFRPAFRLNKASVLILVLDVKK